MPEVCMNNSIIDMDILFEGVYQKLVSPDFGQNLGGELPLFIQQIPVSKQSELTYQANRLVSRLAKQGKKAIIIDLFDLSVKILDEEGVLQTLLEEEKELDSDAISSTLDSILDIKEVVIPRINDIIQEEAPDFTFITGVSRFSKVSIFSDLNNLIDISMSAQFATLLGYTHDEVKKFFPDWIEELAKTLGVSAEEAFGEIVKWYDGYKFHHSAEPVINPVSLGYCLRESEFRTYWSSTAVPTFLVDLLKERPLNLQFAGIDEATLDAYEPTAPFLKTS